MSLWAEIAVEMAEAVDHGGGRITCDGSSWGDEKGQETKDGKEEGGRDSNSFDWTCFSLVCEIGVGIYFCHK